jgi:predicted GIY-YIG superfamily endonuclease
MRHEKQVVYLIEAVGTGRYKIGISKDPKKRLEQLTEGQPCATYKILAIAIVVALGAIVLSPQFRQAARQQIPELSR